MVTMFLILLAIIIIGIFSFLLDVLKFMYENIFVIIFIIIIVAVLRSCIGG